MPAAPAAEPLRSSLFSRLAPRCTNRRQAGRVLGLLLFASLVVTMASFFIWRVVALFAVAGTSLAPSSLTSATAQTATEDTAAPPNVLFIVLDQLRHDAIGIVQSRMASKYGNKVHVRTPNMDRLATELGLMFETAYCQMPSCSPSRSTLKTGCTVARHGVTSNYVSDAAVYKLLPAFQQRIEALVSFEQILQQQKKYRVETYGRWHTPLRWYNNAIEFNYYSYRDKLFHFAPEMTFRDRYVDSLGYFNKSAYETLEQTSPGQTLISRYSTFPYTPIRIDEREMAAASLAAAATAAEGALLTSEAGDSLATSPPHQFYYYSKENMTLSKTEVSMSPVVGATTPGPAAAPTAPFRAELNAFTDDAAIVGSGSGSSSSGGTAASAGGMPVDEAAASGDRGRDALAVNYTSTAIEGDMALRALDRLITEQSADPFFLSVHFLSPVRPLTALYESDEVLRI
jgi:Sulfatase